MKRAQALTALWPSWSRCWSGLGANGEGRELFANLIAAYDEPQRRYHTLQHLHECLSLFETYRALAIEPDEVEVSLWFHDAIYQVRASDNEEKSARWAEDSLRAASVEPERIARIRNHILATRHAVLPEGSDQCLLVDIDLSILGAAPERFDQYEAQVQDEYGWVPRFLFRRKRREILAEFLARKSIYSTPSIRDLLEARARENLARSIALLGGQLPAD
jgi:predicted metal-dependent HD superfamily phosphohydrolase